MSERGNTLPDASLDPWERCERILERFEAAWQHGERPTIDTYLPAEAGDRALVLLELVHTDLECRLKTGEAARVEDYLGRYPELGRVPETVLALLTAEYDLRRRSEPDLDEAEYARRFPPLAAALTQRFHAGGPRPGAPWEEGATSTVTETAAAPGPAALPGARPEPARYRSLRLHARGGLGEVLVAQDEELQREVALKRLQTAWADSRDSRRRFLREARITARLQHPGIVPVYGLVHDENGRPCYAMRLIEGASLKDAIARLHQADVPGRDPAERRLALHELLTRFVAVCNTLAYAHSRGIIHRDLKPSNVLLGPYGETLVVDWGLAKPFAPAGTAQAADDDTFTPALGASPEGATQVGQALGTPAYMSPEQAAGRWDVVGPASDVYSLGATLYHLLTGRVPFPTRNVEETLARAQQGEFPPPRQVKPLVPPPLEAVCLKAMARRPEDRYPGALELAADVERWLADEPVSVWREPAPARLARWARRHRTAVVAAAVALVFLLAGGVAGFLVWSAAEQRRQVYLAGLRSSAEAAEEVALAQLHADQLDNAARLLAGAGRQLEAEPALGPVRARLVEEADRAARLARFYALANQAERLEAERSTRPDNFADSGAAAVCEQGLAQFGVFDHEEWWEYLPEKDLTDEQRRRLHEDVYHQLLLLAAVRAKKGMARQGRTGMDAALRDGLPAVRAANRFRPDSYSGGRMEAFAHTLLGEPDRARPVTAREPTGATDYYFSGLIHLGIAIATDPAQNRGFFEQYLLRLAGSVAPLDFQTPLQTAERHFRMAAELEPQHYWSHCWLGLTLAKAGKMDAAELAWSTCVAIQPDYPTAYGFRAMALRHRWRLTAEPAARQRLLERALADCAAVVRLDPDSATGYRDRAACHADAGDWRQALADCDQAVRREPRSAAALVERGLCRQHLKEYEAARADAAQALAVAPGESDAYWLRGTTYVLEGEYERGVVELNEAVRRQPTNAVYRSDRGMANARLGQWAPALTDFAKMAEARPEDALAGSRVALLRLQRGDAVGYRLTCAGLADRLGRTTDPATAGLVARTCVLGPGALAEPGRAADLAERAVQAKGSSAACRVTLGAALYRQGKLDRAAEVLRDAVPSAGPADAALGRLFLTMTEARLGHAAEAAKGLAEARAAVETVAPGTDPFEKLRLQVLAAEAEKVVKSAR